MKKIVILGSTGSIGRQTLEVIRGNRNFFQVVGITCNRNLDLLKKQISEFRPRFVGINDRKIKINLDRSTKGTKFFYGEEGILELINLAQCDIVVVAMVGAAGLKPAMTAIESGKNIALATKEVMVLAGELIKKALKEKNRRLKQQRKKTINLFPIDSEHSAIWQSLRAGNKNEIEKIILTCSGGPFRGKKKEELKEVTVEQALAHPNWKMGKRITIDSATLMNKGLEIIEAKWLFDIEVNKIEVVIHPQSILHSGVIFRDGSIIGQFGLPDMRIPIQYALTYPQRLKNNFLRISFLKTSSLTFAPPDLKTFPCLTYAYQAVESGGTMPTVLNAADEIAVKLFLENKIKFLDIPKIILKTMTKHRVIKNPSLEEILEVDQWARKKAYESCQ